MSVKNLVALPRALRFGAAGFWSAAIPLTYPPPCPLTAKTCPHTCVKTLIFNLRLQHALVALQGVLKGIPAIREGRLPCASYCGSGGKVAGCGVGRRRTAAQMMGSPTR